MRAVVFLCILLITGGGRPAMAGSAFDDVFSLPQLPPPARYGNILISRLTRSSTHPPVAFSHWVHRRYYTCRVCHFELNFEMKTNATDITEAKIGRSMKKAEMFMTATGPWPWGTLRRRARPSWPCWA